MRRIRWEFVVLGLAALSMGAGCPLVPKISDKVIELAVGGSTTTTWGASGLIDVYSDNQTVDLSTLDLPSIISGAGIDASDIESVKVVGISYRVTRKDPLTTRTIQGGTVSVQRTGGAVTPLVTSFSVRVDADSLATYQTAPLDAAGVTVLNGILADLLLDAQGTPASNTSVKYVVAGTSTPVGVNSDFEWQLKLDVSIVGKKKIKVVG